MRDAVGNELKVGDLVALSLERPLIFGRVVEMAQGGIVTGMKNGQPDARPSRIVIQSIHTIDYDPRAAMIPAILCLRDSQISPAPEDKNAETEEQVN